MEETPTVFALETPTDWGDYGYETAGVTRVESNQQLNNI